MGNISDQIEYVPEDLDFDKLKDGEQRTKVNQLIDLSLREIIERWDKSQTHGEEGKVLDDDYFVIPQVLRYLFNIPSVQEVNASIKSISEAVDALDAKLRNHRHELDKSYSAKPEF